jgi:hypothetical protein
VRFSREPYYDEDVRIWLSLSLLVSLSGCPRNVNVPDPPSGAARCSSERDCNDTADGGEPCGLLFACVEGLCEQSPTRVVPCAGL